MGNPTGAGQPWGASLIQGKNLLLRPVMVKDVTQAYIDWLNDPDVSRFMETRHAVHTPESVKAYVRKMQDNPGVVFMAIVHRQADKHIGNIKLERMSSPVHLRAEVSLFIGEKLFLGKGLGVEAIVLLRDYAFSTLGLHKLTAGYLTENTASARAFEKAEFTREAVLREHCWIDGRWVDAIRLACFAPAGVGEPERAT